MKVLMVLNQAVLRELLGSRNQCFANEQIRWFSKGFIVKKSETYETNTNQMCEFDHSLANHEFRTTLFWSPYFLNTITPKEHKRWDYPNFVFYSIQAKITSVSFLFFLNGYLKFHANFSLLWSFSFGLISPTCFF